MLTKIDWYIIKKFLGTFVYILILLMSISMVFDLSEKLDTFLAAGAPWSQIIFVYYTNFFIFYGFQFVYLINFISVIWFTSKMANNSEIVPILSAGVSFRRMLLPYFIAASVLVVITVLITNYVLPESNKSRLHFEANYYDNAIGKFNVRTQVSENEVLYFNILDGRTAEILEFSLEKWDGDLLKYLLKVNRAVGDSLSNEWHFDRYELRAFGHFHDTVSFGYDTDTLLSFGLKDIIFRTKVIESMNNRELDAFIEKERLRGSEKVPTYLLEKYRRWATPFSIFVLTLVGVSVSSRKSKGGLGVNIAIGLGVTMVYIFSMQVTGAAAIKVGFPPLLAVWTPNILFAGIALLLYKRVPK